MQSKHIFGQHHHSPPHSANVNFYHFYTQPSHALNLPQNRNSTPQLQSASDQEQKRERETYLVSIEEERKEEKPRAVKIFLFCPRVEGRNQGTTAWEQLILHPSLSQMWPFSTSTKLHFISSSRNFTATNPRTKPERETERKDRKIFSDSLCVSLACYWGNFWANLS